MEMKTVIELKQGTVLDTRMTTNKQKIRSIGEDLEKLELLCTIGNVRWCGHCENQCGDSSKN